MRYFRFIFISFFILCCNMPTKGNDVFCELDQYVARRAEFMQKKQAQIDLIKAELHKPLCTEKKLDVYDRLFQAYYTFRFDSSMVYVNRGLHLAKEAKKQRFHRSFQYSSWTLTCNEWLL